jgi:uncharacterized protein DUF2017
VGDDGEGLLTRKVVKRRRDGTYELRLEDWERTLLASLPGQLRAAIDEAPADPWLQRLFPVTYAQDPEAEAEFRRLMAGDLLEKRYEQLDALAAAASAESLQEEELVGTVQAVNDLRLYLGTRLDVSEETEFEDFEEDSPDATLYELYQWLSVLQELMIQALSSS